MKHLFPYILGMLVLVQSCTGQKPAGLKNSTTPRRAVKASCSSMVFEGQVLSRKNILNIFDCSGWAKKYPDLNLAIKNADDASVDNAFKVINDTFFNTKEKRKKLYELVANAEARGEMKTLGLLLEKGLSEHKILSQVNKALNLNQLESEDVSKLMTVLSESNAENLKIVKSLRHLTLAYELNKTQISGLLTDEDKVKLTERTEVLLEDFSKNMDSKDWKHLSGILYDGDSPIQNWAQNGVNGNLNILLDVIEEPGFYQDVTFLKNSLDTGIRCTNRSSKKDFNINVGQELKHKIEGLKNENKEVFENLLLHGMTKFLAFQEFCEERERNQGLNSFYMVLKHAFSVLPSTHDFKFLKRIHQIFDEDRFVFLSFLSSDSFAALRNLLIDLSADGRDQEMVRSLYEVLAELSSEDLAAFSELVHEISLDKSQVRSWYYSWSKLWHSQSTSDRKDFVRLLSLLLDDQIKASDAIHFAETVLVTFPDLSSALAGNLKDKSFQDNVRYVIQVLAEEKAQEQLSGFLSNKGLFELIEIMTHEFVAPKQSSVLPESKKEKVFSYIEPAQSQESILSRACYASLTASYEENTSYYNLVNSLPESCLAILGKVGFVGQIYLWMNASDKYFKEIYLVDDFHAGTGVWSPGMLQFIFTSAVKADLALESQNGKRGIKDNLDEIHRVVTDPRLLETFHQFSTLYTQTNKILKLDSKLLQFIDRQDDAGLNQLTADGFKLMEKADPYTNLVIKPTSCKDLASQLGANPCLNKTELNDGFLQLLRILKRKNEKDNSLIKELVTWIHPAGGIELPFRKSKTRVHKASIDEIIRFLYDLSSDKTYEQFIYQTKSKSEPVQGNVLDRLEVVIRDIGFLNNFYGAHFKNMVASAEEYRSDVVDSEKLLKMLDGSGGILRGVNAFPADSKYRLKNIRQTYKSLIDLSDIYEQADGTTRSYGPFIQSLLAAIGESSKLSTQKFNPYRVPNERIVEGHNGIFLTKVVEMSGLRHLANFVRARFDSTLSSLNTNDFKKINSNFVGRYSLEKVKSSLQLVLDKYLDNDRNQLNLMLEDGVSFVTSLKDDEQKVFEEIALKSIILLSSDKVSTVNIENLAKLAELSIEMWPEIRVMLSQIENKKELLLLINKMFDHLLQNPDALNRLATSLEASNVFVVQDIRRLLGDEAFLAKAPDFLNQLVRMHDFQTDLNWIETFKMMFSPHDTQWESLKTWFQVSLGTNDKKLTLSLLISFLGEKNDEGYRLRGIMDELFLNHRPELEQFLAETFKSLEFKPD
jgi:hypothetical protein